SPGWNREMRRVACQTRWAAWCPRWPSIITNPSSRGRMPVKDSKRCTGSSSSQHLDRRTRWRGGRCFIF
ncbi:hypothetical protein EV182_007019, partial [Spiromyces aspiralis]